MTEPSPCRKTSAASIGRQVYSPLPASRTPERKQNDKHDLCLPLVTMHRSAGNKCDGGIVYGRRKDLGSQSRASQQVEGQTRLASSRGESVRASLCSRLRGIVEHDMVIRRR